jgi:hypothetical protein
VLRCGSALGSNSAGRRCDIDRPCAKASARAEAARALAEIRRDLDARIELSGALQPGQQVD